MHESGIHSVEIVFLILLAFIIVFANLARRLEVPYPIVLVIAGLFLGFVPGMPAVTLNPDLIFFVVLPPLLYAAAWMTSWRNFSYNLSSILMLAFLMVGATVLSVAAVTPLLFPGFDWQTALVLGAVVSTTDAVAATSIARRIRLPQRIVDILEGESLVNDATGLLTLEFALSLLVTGQHPTFAFGVLRLLYLIGVGVGVGILIGVCVKWYEGLIEDGPIEVTISVLVPYAAYLAADALQASGVLAVVTCGLYLSYRRSEFLSAPVRLQTYSVWSSLTFLFNGLVFVLIGLQLPYVLKGIQGYSTGALIGNAVLFCAFLIVVRLVWIYPGAFVGYSIRRRLLKQKESMPPAKYVFVVGWTGMRGVVALAAAIALPEARANGIPFAQRNLILFLTFCVILVTLVVQGLTLPVLIQWLGLSGIEDVSAGEARARRAILESALQYVERKRASAQDISAYEDAETHLRRRLALISDEAISERDGLAQSFREYCQLSLELIEVQRKAAIELRNEGRINDGVLRMVERELDLEESRYAEG